MKKLTTQQTKGIFKNKTKEDFIGFTTPKLTPNLKCDSGDSALIMQVIQKTTNALIEAQESVMFDWIANRKERFLYISMENNVKVGITGRLIMDYSDVEYNKNAMMKSLNLAKLDVFDRNKFTPEQKELVEWVAKEMEKRVAEGNEEPLTIEDVNEFLKGRKDE